MTTAQIDIEARLTEALHSVAEQIEPVAPAGGRYADADPSDGDEHRQFRSRTLWLAVAAMLVVGFGAIGYTAYGRVTTTEAAGTGDASEQVPTSQDLAADLPSPLLLLPAETFELSDQVEFASGAEVIPEGDLSAIAVGRRTESGYEDLLPIFHTTSNGSFSVDEASSQLIAGRQFFDSFDEGVVEQLDDGTNIIYQIEFTDARLERAVAATSVIDGELVFEDPEGVLETVSSIGAGNANPDFTLASFPEGADAPPLDGPVVGFMLTGKEAADPSEAIYLASSFGATDLQETPVDGTGETLLIGRPAPGISVVAWAPAPGHVAAALVMGGDDDAVIDFITTIRIVDEETWLAELATG